METNVLSQQIVAQIRFDKLPICGFCFVAMAQPTILDESQPIFDQEEHSSEPDAKRQKGPDDERVPETSESSSVEKTTLDIEELPTGIQAKWVRSKKGMIIPFVRNPKTDVIHCGYSRMKMVAYKSPGTNRDHRLILCLTGCEDGCEGPDACKCFCHILQADYDLRNYDTSL